MGYKTKKFGKNRAWLNPRDNYCMAAVGWYVEIGWPTVHNKENHAHLDASFSVNEEGRSWHITRRAHLRQLHTVRKQMDAFEAAVDEALAWGKEQGFTLYKD